jgi:hypothetical protein
MRYLISFFIFFCVVLSLSAQYTRLVPSWRPIPEAPSSNAPDYGALISTVTSEIQRWANIKCMKSINSQLERLIPSARSRVSQKTTYVVVIDYTNIGNCKVSSFEPHYGNGAPSVLHPTGTKMHVYTMEIYPYIEINGKFY